MIIVIVGSRINGSCIPRMDKIFIMEEDYGVDFSLNLFKDWW